MNELLEKIKAVFNSTAVYWIVVIAVVIGICYGVEIFRSQDVHDNGVSVDRVGKQIEQVGDKQRDISNGLQRAESAAGSVTGSIGESQERIRAAQDAAGRIDATIKEQRDIIADCQRIIAEVRSRAEADAGAH